MSALTAALVLALEKRYSICATFGVPGARSAAISAGTTQACAVPVADVATPTTVRCGEPATPLTVICDPTDTGGPSPPRDHTTSPVRCAQRPASSVRSSTGPPGDARPIKVSCSWKTPWPPEPPGPPGGTVKLTFALSVVCAHGPDGAVTR